MQVRVRTNMSDPFPKKIVRERLTEFSLLNSVIRLLRGEIAGFRVLVVAGYRVSVDTLVRCVGENVDFRLYPDSLRALLYLTVTKSRRLCFEALPTAFVIQFERRGYGEQTTRIRNPPTIRTSIAAENRYPATTNTLYPALSPRRRRIPSGAARERSSHVLDSTKLVRTWTCTN